MPWIGPAIGLAGSLFSGDSGSSGGGASGSGAMYVPTNLGGVDQGWQNAFNASGALASGTQGTTSPYYQQSLNQSANIDYNPYIQGANQAGSMYDQAGQLAGQQMGQYGQMAQRAAGQQQNMYDLGAQVANTAFDPQNALFNKTQQTLQDQVRQGQAARGLGNSSQGSMEENNAMSNFDIAWQNNQLQRQTQGLAADVGANAQGVNQGRMYGADQSAALGAGAAGAGYYQQSGQVPVQAQQYAAAQPGAAASTYQQQMLALQGMYGNAQNGAIPYLNNGQGAQQGNYGAMTANNAAQAQGFSQLGSAIAPSVASWFGGAGSGAGQTYNNPSAYGGAQPYMQDTNTYTPTY